MSKKKNTAIVLWVLAIVFFIGSLSLLKSDIAAFFVGLAICLVLAVIGVVQFKKYKKWEAENVRDKNGVPYLKSKKKSRKKTTPKAPPTNIEVPDALNGYVRRYSYNDVFVAYNTEYSAGVPIGDYLEIRPEPDNPYDSKALALYYNNDKIGYLPANSLQEMYYKFTKKSGMVKARAAAFSGKNMFIALAYFEKLPEVS